MNNSGQAVKSLYKKYCDKTEDVLVVYDDLDLKLGKTRIRFSGSSGGHKGVESIISELRTKDFVRIREGIGRANKVKDAVNFVITGFSKEDKVIINESIQKAAEAAIFLKGGNNIEDAMNKFN